MSEAPPAVGSRVGNYVLTELVGQGAFGQVWKAVHHERPGRIVAMKIAIDPAFRQQLTREGGLPDFDHPNVLPILDSDTRFAEIPYLVMPYLPGGNLAELISTHSRGLPEERVESLLRDILAGLSAAHERGIVHRDLKPWNVLLDAAGRAVISDFGLSLTPVRLNLEQSIVQSLSFSVEQGGSLAGTMAYIAPEVLAGAVATPAADVYAVGLMLFEMLVGRRPAGAEVPARRRADLRRPEMWNLLYQRACCPSEERLADARAMSALFETVVGAYRKGLVHPFEETHSLTPLTDEPFAPPADRRSSPAPSPSVVLPQAAAISPDRLLTLDLGGGVRLELVQIPPGEFKMGSPPSEPRRGDDEGEHRVSITGMFYVGRLEVTQAQWRAVLGGNPSVFVGDELPVDDVSWLDARRFCLELAKRTGRPVRLPTEAEWEYACRAGMKTAYHFGTQLTADLANFDSRAAGPAGQGVFRGQTMPAGCFPPNAWGLHDMHGNVWEWCLDWYGPYPSVLLSDPIGPPQGRFRVLRGGSWNSSAAACRCANRCTYTPDYRSREFGLRIVVEAE